MSWVLMKKTNLAGERGRVLNFARARITAPRLPIAGGFPVLHLLILGMTLRDRHAATVPHIGGEEVNGRKGGNEWR